MRHLIGRGALSGIKIIQYKGNSWGGGGDSGLQVTGMVRDFLGFESFDSRIVLGRRSWQDSIFFFVWLDLSGYLSWEFFEYSKQLFVVVPVYTGRVVLRIKYNQTCFAVVLIFNVLHCICFIKTVI